MKRFLPILFSLFFVGAFSQSTINPFKLDSIEWYEVEGRFNGQKNPFGTDYYCNFYRICGDTIINDSVTYKKLYYGSKLYFMGINGCPPFNCVKPVAPDSFSFYCFFRQDSATKSTYYRMPNDTTDNLLCSYNLNLGDTIKTGLYGGYFGGNPLVVSHTDSILVEGKKFKIYNIDSCMGGNCVGYCNLYYNNMFLIEGLGASSGLFYSFNRFGEYENNRVDSISYHCDCNKHPLSIKSTQQNTSISISPNPSNGNFIIEPLINDKQFAQLIDVNGRVVWSAEISGKTTVNAAFLNGGLYNLTIKNQAGILNRRVIISK